MNCGQPQPAAQRRNSANGRLVGLLLFSTLACNQSTNSSPPDHPRATTTRPVPVHEALARSPIDLGPPPSEGGIGSADSIWVSTENFVSLDGTWLVACQAREDDFIHPFLVSGAGAGIPVQGGIVRRHGRFWAVAVDDELIVLDLARAQGSPAWPGPRELDPARVRARIPLERIASASASSFDDAAELFVFIARAPRSLVVLDLRDGSERTIEHGSGYPIDATSSHGTLGVLLQRTPPATSPWQPPSLCYASGMCGGVVSDKPDPTFFRHFELGSDSRGSARPMAAEADPADGGLTRARPGVLLRDLDQGIALRRLGDGSIVWQRGERQEALVPAHLAGAVQRVVDIGGKVLICSGPDPYARSLRLFGPGGEEVDLGLICRAHGHDDLLEVGHDTFEVHDPRVDRTVAIVNVTTGQVQPVDRRHRVLFDRDDRTYVSAESTSRLPGQLAAIDWSSGEYSVVALGDDEFAMTAHHWGYMHRVGQLVDLDTAAVVGDVRDGIVPFAIAPSGHLLMPKASHGPGWMMADGPLRWEAPLSPSPPLKPEPHAPSTTSCDAPIPFCGSDYPADAKKVECGSAELESLEPLRCLTNLRHLQLSYYRSAPSGRSVVQDNARPPELDLSPLSGLTKLEWLGLGARRVKEISPLAGLPLKWLDLSHTDIEGLGPLTAMTSLRTLDLEDTPIEDISVLSTLTGLYALDLARTRVDDLSALRDLDLWLLELRGALDVRSVEPLSSQSKLEFLGLRGTAVADLAPLAGLTRLTRLDISWTEVERLDALSETTNLESLTARGTRIHDLRPLRKNTALKDLDLMQTLVTDLRPLARLPLIETVRIDEEQVDNRRLLRRLNK